MKLYICKSTVGVVHASENGTDLVCRSVTMFQHNGAQELTLQELQNQLTCQKCQSYFAPKAPEKKSKIFAKAVGSVKRSTIEAINKSIDKVMSIANTKRENHITVFEMPAPSITAPAKNMTPVTEEVQSSPDTAPEVITAPSTEDMTSDQDIHAMVQGKILKFYFGSEKTVTVPEYVEIIEKSAFIRAELTSLEIPDTVTEIRDFAFALCHNLTEITLPQNVRLGKHVFYKCAALEIVKIRFPNGVIGTFRSDAAEAMFPKL